MASLPALSSNCTIEKVLGFLKSFLTHSFWRQFHLNIMKILCWSWVSMSKVTELKISTNLSSPPGQCPTSGGTWLLILFISSWTPWLSCYYCGGNVLCPFLLLCCKALLSPLKFSYRIENTALTFLFHVYCSAIPHLRTQEQILKDCARNNFRVRHQGTIISSFTKNPMTWNRMYAPQFSLLLAWISSPKLSQTLI